MKRKRIQLIIYNQRRSVINEVVAAVYHEDVPPGQVVVSPGRPVVILSGASDNVISLIQRLSNSDRYFTSFVYSDYAVSIFVEHRPDFDAMLSDAYQRAKEAHEGIVKQQEMTPAEIEDAKHQLKMFEE